MEIKVFLKDDGDYRLAAPKCTCCGFYVSATIEEILHEKGYICQPCIQHAVDSTIDRLEKPRRVIAHKKLVYDPIKDC